MVLPVSMPSEAPSPKIKKKSVRGPNPAGGGLFRLSPTERTTMRSTAVARTSEADIALCKALMIDIGGLPRRRNRRCLSCNPTA
jgi:hypothetical protein